jgi:hypothetical protein
VWLRLPGRWLHDGHDTLDLVRRQASLLKLLKLLQA